MNLRGTRFDFPFRLLSPLLILVILCISLQSGVRTCIASSLTSSSPIPSGSILDSPSPSLFSIDRKEYRSLLRVERDSLLECTQYPRGSCSIHAETKTMKGNLLRVFKIRHPMGDIFMEESKRSRAFFNHGLHPREFLPVESALHVLERWKQELLIWEEKQSRSTDKEEKDVNLDRGNDDDQPHPLIEFLLRYADVYIVVLATPDGRGELESSRDSCLRTNGNHVDLNRNFPWNFGASGSTEKIGSEEYHGPDPLSEVESRFLDEQLRTIFPHLLIDMHSGVEHIYYPFADSESRDNNRMIENRREIHEFANMLAASIPIELSGRRYSFGPDRRYSHFSAVGSASAIGLYPADGTLLDHAFGNLNISFVFAVEMWGSGQQEDPCFELMNPPVQILSDILDSFIPFYESALLELIVRRTGEFPDRDSMMTDMSGSLARILFTIEKRISVLQKVSRSSTSFAVGLSDDGETRSPSL